MGFVEYLPSTSHAELESGDIFQPMSMEQAQRLAGISDDGFSPYGRSSLWYRYCREFRIYEYPTAEYIAAFSAYLDSRIASLELIVGERVRVLELGAGSGRLAHALDKNLEKANVYAVDNFSWERPRIVSPIVTEMEALQALATFQPHIAIACWVPSGELDWTSGIRAMPTVREYLLVGEHGKHAASTAWGCVIDAGEPTNAEYPMYARDGFTKTELSGLRQYQLCYEDALRSNGTMSHRSTTVSFCRIQ